MHRSNPQPIKIMSAIGRRCQLLAGGIAILFLSASWVLLISQARAAAADDETSSGTFRRGIAIHDAMNRATLESSSSNRYLFPPFSDPDHQMNLAELAIIRRAGFDFIRLTVDPGPFLQFHGPELDATYGVLRARVEMILETDLAVIVDFHPVLHNPEFAPRALVSSTSSPLFAAYCSMLSRTAAVLGAFGSKRVALELINEPDTGDSPEADALWQRMEEKAYRAARAASASLFLILQGDDIGEVRGLLSLDARPFAHDRFAAFTFHYYEPFEFTNQSLPNYPNGWTAADVPYPALARPMSDSMYSLALRLKRANESPIRMVADTALGYENLVRYRVSNFSRENIHSDFDRVTNWAHRYGIPSQRIFLGEFGVIRRNGPYQGARDAERALWLHDVREEAESHGYFWSIWVYRGYGGMAIVKNGLTSEIDPLTLTALGFR